MYENPSPSQRRILHAFRPTYIAPSVADIDFDYLQRQGIKAVYIDLDGTVVARGTFDVDDRTKRKLRQQPLPIYIATNRPKSRGLKNLKESLNATGVVHPRGLRGKPFPHYFTASLLERGFRPEEAVMIGDRYLQDIAGGRIAGLKTLLVHKYDRPTNWFDRLLSATENQRTKHLMKRYRPVK